MCLVISIVVVVNVDQASLAGLKDDHVGSLINDILDPLPRNPLALNSLLRRIVE